MTTIRVHRPARATRPQAPEDKRTIEAPPVLPEGSALSGAQSMLPLAGAGSSMAMMLVFRGSPLAAVGALVMVLTVLATAVMVVGQRGQATRTRRQQRERYLDYLEEQRDDLLQHERARQRQARALDPAPGALLDVVRDSARLWERRRLDHDFLRVRVGVGARSDRTFSVGDQGSAVHPTDAFMRAEAQALARRFEVTPGVPLAFPLDLSGDVSVVGDREAVLAAARALLLQIAALHAPEDVALALCHSPDRYCDWEWARWLPHLADPELRDTAGPVRRIAPDPASLAELLAGDLSARAARADKLRRNLGSGADLRSFQRLLVVLDGYGAPATSLPLPDRAATASDLAITVVHLVDDRRNEPGEVSARLVVAGHGATTTVTVEDLRSEPTGVSGVSGLLDDAPAALAEGVARMLAPLRLSPESYDDGSGNIAADLLALLDLPEPGALDLPSTWRRSPGSGERDFLRVPLGIDDDGRSVLLDLKEPAQMGMGPHGLCVGATGSGKSELLRTLVLALLLRHPPEQLSMVLVDYKGGATFAPFDRLPHVAGVITNLADDLGLVERVHTSLAGEVQRRQQVLKEAGNVANITDYQVLRAQQPGLPPLPHLLVIIDEFGELLTAEPDFIELFLSIGRIGRSIGVHLLLSSQRIEAGKLKGLDTYLSYRLGLRTFSETESRTVLDTPDAFSLPPLPGYGYLKVDTTVYRRFAAAYVSGPYRPGADEEPLDAGPRVVRVPVFGTPSAASPGADEEEESRVALPLRTTGPTLLSMLVDRLRDAADPVPRIWLPPLSAAIALDRVTGGVEVGEHGLQARVPAGRLRIPLGVLDDPARQWQGRWDLDLTRAGGHVAVIGGPQSGRSTLLRTLVLGLALSHTPREVAVYGVDLLGGGLSPLADLPHVGGVAGRGDRERARRTLEEVRAMIDDRERVFRERHIDSLDAMRRAHAAGEIPELPVADVVLLLDGYGQLAGDFEELEPLVHAVLARGGSYGVHLVATVSRWGEVRLAQQAAFGSRVELRLNDPGDSTIDRKLAATIKDDVPGRALLDGKLLAHVALPRIDSSPDRASLAGALGQAVRAVRSAWTGPTAPPVRVLPARLPGSELPQPGEVPFGVPLGLEESDFTPEILDLFGRDTHLLVLGDAGSGKTNLLRLLARGLIQRHGPEELVFAVVDPRRGLRDAIPEDYLGGYASTAGTAAQLAAAVTTELAKRSPDDPAGGSGSNPRIVLVVDDYDVLVASGAAPLADFTAYLSVARDVGLHVLLTRRVSGASRGLYEPLVMGLREAGAAGLVMSGDRSEGLLFSGVRAGRLPVGRGLLVRPGEPVRTVQTGLAEPLEAAVRESG